MHVPGNGIRPIRQAARNRWTDIVPAGRPVPNLPIVADDALRPRREAGIVGRSPIGRDQVLFEVEFVGIGRLPVRSEGKRPRSHESRSAIGRRIVVIKEAVRISRARTGRIQHAAAFDKRSSRIASSPGITARQDADSPAGGGTRQSSQIKQRARLSEGCAGCRVSWPRRAADRRRTRTGARRNVYACAGKERPPARPRGPMDRRQNQGCRGIELRDDLQLIGTDAHQAREGRLVCERWRVAESAIRRGV